MSKRYTKVKIKTTTHETQCPTIHNVQRDSKLCKLILTENNWNHQSYNTVKSYERRSLFSLHMVLLNTMMLYLPFFSQHVSSGMLSVETRKPSYRWQTRATRKPDKNCSNSTCLQRCRWQYWPMRLTAIASEIREIPRNLLKIQTYGVQGHPRSSILVSIESPYVTCY